MTLLNDIRADLRIRCIIPGRGDYSMTVRKSGGCSAARRRLGARSTSAVLRYPVTCPAASSVIPQRKYEIAIADPERGFRARRWLDLAIAFINRYPARQSRIPRSRG